MPLTRSDIPYLMNPAIKAVFFEAYDAALAKADWMRICTVIPSTSDAEDYAWLGALPAMRLFKDERVLKDLKEYHYNLINEKYEATLGIDVDAINDSKYGQIEIRVRGLAQEVVRYKEYLVMSAVNNGATNLAYDNTAFFDGSRTIGASGTIDNSDTAAITQANLQAAIVKMMAYKDDMGKPMGIRPDTLVVGPDKYLVALELLTSQVNAEVSNANQYRQNMDNVIKQLGIQLIVSPYIAATRWFLFDTSKAVKPIILQDREGPIFSALEGSSDIGFMRDQYAYGVKWRGTVGYGLPQTGYYSVG